MSYNRSHNFSAGPAVLPEEVVEKLAQSLPNFRNSGLGLMELSHRSKVFDDVILSADQRLRSLMGIPDDYAVLFLQGGASLQFYMTALNLLGPDDCGAYINTGTWSTNAIKEAKRCAQVAEVWTPENKKFTLVPKDDDYALPRKVKYLHYTSNNTIYGTQFSAPPNKDKRLIADLSSDICSQPIDVSKHCLLYAGAQKNLGPSGVTAVILSPWAVERSRKVNTLRAGGLPSMLNYALMVEKNSMFNTPNTFGIFALDCMLEWLEQKGGVSVIQKENAHKAKLIYDVLDSSDFWVPHAQKDSRSKMNITWRLQNAELEKLFLKDAEANHLEGLKGHRSVGGIRASIYNACPTESVETLVDFMKDFANRH